MSFSHVRPYRFYCCFRKGDNEIRIESVQHETSGRPVSGYAKIGRLKEQPQRVRLHYGLARVFVKSETPDAVFLQAKIAD